MPKNAYEPNALDGDIALITARSIAFEDIMTVSNRRVLEILEILERDIMEDSRSNVLL